MRQALLMSMLTAMLIALFVGGRPGAAAGRAAAESFQEIGFRAGGLLEVSEPTTCTGTLVHNHDGSFENGYCWQMPGIRPPY